MTVKTPIVSRTNPLVKKLRKLSLRKYREDFGEYIAEGKRWISDAKRICPQNVSAVICAQSCVDPTADYILADGIFAELTSLENSQGILALMKIPPRQDIFTEEACLFLDRVRDPGNMGTIIRTACAAGYRDIVLRDCVDVYSAKVIRSCMTGVLNVRFHYAEDLSPVLQNGYSAVAAVLNGANVFDRPVPKGKICLVIGNEANGIEESIVRQCAYRVTIPMQEGMESLNAAVSAGILMYELKFNK